ncbi:Deoxyribonuclease-1, partial [Araneus ventricosus]
MGFQTTEPSQDILIMGDFNADCDYVKEQHWDSISLWTRPEFTWAIPRTEDTTTNYRSCALDRIVYAGENMNSGVILSSAKAFDYRYEFDVTMQEARSISDHWPVEVKIRGK